MPGPISIAPGSSITLNAPAYLGYNRFTLIIGLISGNSSTNPLVWSSRWYVQGSLGNYGNAIRNSTGHFDEAGSAAPWFGDTYAFVLNNNSSNTTDIVLNNIEWIVT